jgi:hypothetical protein
MESMRPSILRRPIRATSCTKETSEEQYQREQVRSASLQCLTALLCRAICSFDAPFGQLQS